MGRPGGFRVRQAAAAIVLIAASARPAAAQDQWEVEEVYSNSDGSVQFVELSTTAPLQNNLQDGLITVTWPGGSNVFLFGTNVVGDTTDRHLLLATAGFDQLCGGVASDFTLLPDTPDNFFFDPDAAG